jgi:hypothetical protein
MTDDERAMIVATIEATLPSDPRDLLTEEDRVQFGKWAEQNRLRKAQISMETGIDHVG